MIESDETMQSKAEAFASLLGTFDLEKVDDNILRVSIIGLWRLRETA